MNTLAHAQSDHGRGSVAEPRPVAHATRPTVASRFPASGREPSAPAALQRMEERMQGGRQALETQRLRTVLDGAGPPVVQRNGYDDPPRRRRKKKDKRREKGSRRRHSHRDKKRERREKRYLEPFIERQMPKERGSRHSRKEKRLAKVTGTLFEDVPPESLSLVEPEEEERDVEELQELHLEESDSDVASQSSVSSRSSRRPRERETLSQKVIGEEFYQALKDEGVPIFLSGGSAITYQGGPREAGDLDFRVTMKDAGFSSFNEPRGRAVLAYINQVVLPNSRLEHKDLRRGTADQFTAMGGNALTIGTPDWFGVEVSLSLVAFEPEELVDLGEIGRRLGIFGTEIPDIPALSLQELRSDKLKSLITRRKSGEQSVKKIAKDLFDYLTLVYVLHDDEEEDLDSEAMEEVLRQSTSRKLGEYSYVSHDQTPWLHAPRELVEELMRARTVMTARTHTRTGERREAFLELARTHGLEEEMEEMLAALAGVHVPKRLGKALSPWFKEWNRAPSFAPPSPFKKLEAPRMKPSGLPQVAERPESVRPAFEVLDELPEEYLEGPLDQKLVGRKLTDNETTVLKVLAASKGFRALGDPYTNMDTLMAFGLTKSQFNRAWRPLAKAKLVSPEKDGLHLTETGRKALGLD